MHCYMHSTTANVVCCADGPEALALRLFEAATLSSPASGSGKEAGGKET